MLEFFRSHQRLMQLVLVAVMLPFAFFGVYTYQGMTDAQSVAEVDGHPITEQDFEVAQRDALDQRQRMLGTSVDPATLNTPEARAQILDQLITQRIIALEIQKKHLATSQQAVLADIAQIPQIRSLYGPDGKIDKAALDRLLAQSGMTMQQLMASARQDILNHQAAGAIASSAIVPAVLALRLDAAQVQTREVRMQSFKPSDFAGQIQVSDADLKSYYDAHPDEFKIPEQVDIQYLVFDQGAVEASITVPPDDIKKAYEQDIARYTQPEERRASHILIAVPKTATPAERDKAKIKAQEVLAQVRAHPQDFAKLAKAYSQDPGSAENGGDLGWAPASNYVAPFSEALFKLKENQISEVVSTEFGYHIILCTGIKPATVRPLDDVKDQIEAELKRRLASSRFPQAAEDFRNIVFGQADSLEPAAKKFGLKLQTASGITRTPDPAQPKTGLNNDKLRADLFSDDVLKAKHNTEAVETGPSTLIAARVTHYTPSAEKPLAQVTDELRKKLVQERAVQKAHAEGMARLAALEKDPSDAGFGAPITVSRISPAGQSGDAIRAIFAVDAGKLPGVTGLDLPDGTYVLYRVERVNQPAPNPAQAQQLSNQLNRYVGALDLGSYLAALKKEYKVTISKKFTDAVPPPPAS